jgi:acyl carrier protein
MDKQEIRKELHAILNIVDDKLLERVEITDDTSIREGLGLDSLQLTEMLFEIEERLNAKIADEEARDLRTVGDLITLIETKTAG